MVLIVAAWPQGADELERVAFERDRRLAGPGERKRLLHQEEGETEGATANVVDRRQVIRHERHPALWRTHVVEGFRHRIARNLYRSRCHVRDGRPAAPAIRRQVESKLRAFLRLDRPRLGAEARDAI